MAADPTSPIALIPARGGSKRIPRKNIKEFCGQPIIAYTIAALRQSGLFTRILISSDDPEIIALAEEHGAEAAFRRPAAIADDTTPTAAVIVHALEWLRDHDGLPQALCVAYATAPFLRAEYLRVGYEILTATAAPSVFSATAFPFPIQRALGRHPDGRVFMFEPEHQQTRSQDLPEAYHDAGQFYWIDSARFLADPRVYGAGSRMVPLPRYLVQDIDTVDDWILAEALYRALATLGH